MRRITLIRAVLVLLLVQTPAMGQAQTPAATQTPATTVRFPHRLHEGLFPECTVCHRGVQTGVAADMYPAPAACANCHDGKVQPRVGWQGPAPRYSNLAFSHPRHQQSVDSAGETTACLDCHRTPGQQGSMAVSGPQPELCLRCHEHAAAQHMALGAHCTTCHLPLTQTSVPASWIAALPKPPDHSAPDFLLQHAPSSPAAAAGRCAVCHARQSCERCHLNAAAVPAIQALQPDERVARLTKGRAPVYPKPPTHDSDSWQWKHGLVAKRVVGVGASAAGTPAVTIGAGPASASCSDCHVQASCRSCHRGGSTAAIDALPKPGPDSIYGVRIPPRPVHGVGFLKDHPAQAAAGVACGACHSRRFCVDCHQGQQARYHPPDFVEQHGPEAYGTDTQCSACHNTESFCRTCHMQTGRGARTRTGAAFHNAQPLWLLNHGQAARQGLEACTACHTQASCAECHSATGGWGVNPHPANFDAQRAEQLNPQSCLECHAELPHE
jgi:predicted CXXCH cytochrome family protein